MTSRAIPYSRSGTLALLAVIVTLTLATAYIHSTLGGLLFTLNALGYAALAALIVVTTVVPAAVVRRLRWAPRVALGAYALATIGGYLVIGPYFPLGWAAKAIEVALLAGLAVLVRRDHGGIPGIVSEARSSVSWVLRSLRRMAPEAAEVAPREA